MEPGVWTGFIDVLGRQRTAYAVEVESDDGYWTARTENGKSYFYALIQMGLDPANIEPEKLDDMEVVVFFFDA